MIHNLLRRLINYKEMVLFVVAGIAGLIIVDSLLVKGFSKDQNYEELLTKDRIHAKVQSSLEEHVTALIALKVIYQNYYDITPTDFKLYSNSITATLAGFKRLVYIDPSFSIKRIYPKTPENKMLDNYSLTKNAHFMKMLKEANKSERAIKGESTSRFIPFLGNQKSLWTIIPIYRDKGKKKQKEFSGFVAGELSIEAIWELAGEPSASTHYEVQLIDPEGKPLLKSPQLTTQEPPSELDFVLLDQPWRIQLYPLQSNLGKHLFERLLVSTAGLMILLLIVLINYNSKRHKRELFTVNQQFETIFHASPDGILLLDDKLHIQLANPVVASWVNLPAEKLKDKPFFSVFGCNCPHLKKCRSLSHLLCTTGEFNHDLPEVLETSVINTDNEKSFATLRLSAAKINLKRKGKTIHQFICVLGDITASKELEKVKENYIATLTHDLRTPLFAQKTALNNILENDLTKSFPQVQKSLLIGAIESVQDLLDMVNSTLLFYKLESSHLQLSKQHMSLKGLLKDVLNELQPLAEKRDLTIILDSPLDIPDILIDTIQMKRVFHNLLSNALHHSYKKSIIQLRISHATDKQLVLAEVINEGPGIPAELQSKIFDKYYTLSRRFKQIGTGLGLYIAKGVVQLHGGTISVKSEVNKQTCFTVSLPVSHTVTPGQLHPATEQSQTSILS